jgi:hypothetical protein
MSGPAWTAKEISCFLAWTDRLPARSIAARLGRTLPAVNGMRRKLARLQQLKAEPAEFPELLAVAEDLVLKKGLPEIRKRARLAVVPVSKYLRRGRVTGKPHLVDDHVRLPVEKPE